MEESLIGVLGQVLQQAKGSEFDDELGSKVSNILNRSGGIEALSERITRVTAFHDNNYLPLLWSIHANNRAVIFRVFDQIQIETATQDTRLIRALDFIKEHRKSRKEHLPPEIDLRFMSKRWRSFIQVKNDNRVNFDRRSLEVAVFTHLAEALQGGDFYVEDSEAYSRDGRDSDEIGQILLYIFVLTHESIIKLQQHLKATFTD